MNGGEEVLKVEGLEAGYGALQILFGIDMTIKRTEHVLVFGPNGAGKSTFIKALVGLVPPSAGTITLDGRTTTGWAPERMVASGLSYVPQVGNVFSSLGVAENLEIGGASLKGPVRRERIEEMYALFPVLAERRRQPAGTLSGGERQMLALARALIPKPSLLLLDEPSAGVAPRIVEEIFRMVSDLRALSTSVLMIEQNAKQALPHVDRGYVLEGGQVRFSGMADDLLRSDEIRALYMGGESPS